MGNEYKKLFALEEENETLRQELAEKTKALSAIEEAANAESIRAAYASAVLSSNSAMQKLLEKKASELENRRAELDSVNKQLDLAQTELFQAQKMESIGRLAAGVAHEINTPIQFVNDSIFFLDQGLTDLFDLIDQLIASNEETDADARREKADKSIKDLDYEYLKEQTPLALKRASQGIDRVAEIVRSMKSFSHPDRTTMRQVDLNDGLKNTLAIAKNEYKYVADVVTDFGNIPMVECLGGEINQVFLNIIVNAAHAIEDACRGTEGRGTITICTKQVRESVCIEISDTGTGIPVEAQARVFEHFFTTKEVGKGTGQGLSLAHQVIHTMHGGSITFRTAIGKGTTFVITLPINQPISATKEAA